VKRWRDPRMHRRAESRIGPPVKTVDTRGWDSLRVKFVGAALGVVRRPPIRPAFAQTGERGHAFRGVFGDSDGPRARGSAADGPSCTATRSCARADEELTIPTGPWRVRRREILTLALWDMHITLPKIATGGRPPSGYHAGRDASSCRLVANGVTTSVRDMNSGPSCRGSVAHGLAPGGISPKRTLGPRI